MSLKKREKLRRTRKTFRVGNKLQNLSGRMRVSVFRSARHIYAQIIEDASHKTVLSYSSLNITEQDGADKKAVARRVGVELGKQALQHNIKDLIFDRGGYLYHGRVKELADGLREAGLNV
jgi:large subunit ribosomal protein L18